MPSSKRPTYSKRDLRIESATPGWSLDVWQLTPRHVRAPFATVVMAHGFTLHKEHGLREIAENFVRQGLACLVFDYRHFGESDGVPRNHLSPARQVVDYQTVIRYAKRRPDTFDSKGIGVWGFSYGPMLHQPLTALKKRNSYSGGHVFTLAAKDSSLAFAIAQNPSIGGMAQAADMNPFHCLRLAGYSVASISRQAMGGKPVYIRASAGRRKWGLLNMAESGEGFEQVGYRVDDPRVNRVDARFVMASLFYNPNWFAASKVKVPLLCCLGKEDSMVPFVEAKRGAERVQGSELYIYSGGHFSAFTGGTALEEVSEVQIDFIKRHV